MSERCECGHDAAMHTAVLLGGPENRPCWAINCPCHRWAPRSTTPEDREGELRKTAKEGSAAVFADMHKYLTIQADDRTGTLSAQCSCGWEPEPSALAGRIAEGYGFFREWVHHRRPPRSTTPEDADG